MHEKLLAPITDLSAWRSEDLEKDQSWIIHVTPKHTAELLAALALIEKRKLRATEFAKEDFPLPLFGPILADVSKSLEHGRGVVLIRGLPFDGQDDERASILLWGIGAYLGRALKQNAIVNLGKFRENLIAHIIDQGFDFSRPNVHGSATKARQAAHCDPSDLVGLLCVRPAIRGGESHIVSSMAIYNEILMHHPHLLDTLYEGFYHDLRDHGAKTDIGVTPHRIPVYSYFGGYLSCIFNSKTAETAATKLGRPLTALDREAIDTILQLTTDPRFALNMPLVTGDLQFLNNYTVLHSREAWEDSDEYDKKRLMLRLWLKCNTERSLAPGFAGGYVTGSTYDVAEQATQ